MHFASPLNQSPAKKRLGYMIGIPESHTENKCKKIELMLNLAIKSRKHLAVAQHSIQTHLSWKGKDGNNIPAVTRKKVISIIFSTAQVSCWQLKTLQAITGMNFTLGTIVLTGIHTRQNKV